MSNIKFRIVPLDSIVRDLSKTIRTAVQQSSPNGMNGLAKHQAELGLVQSCLSCTHFREHEIPMANGQVMPAEICKKYNARPPARIIAFGCPDYEDIDDIPF